MSIQGLSSMQVPFILVRMDWMALAQNWLEWCRENMQADKVIAPDGKTADEIREWVTKAIAELDELLRVSQVNVLSSPLVFMRSMQAVHDAGEDVPMPPPKPGEVGS